MNLWILGLLFLYSFHHSQFHYSFKSMSQEGMTARREWSNVTYTQKVQTAQKWQVWRAGSERATKAKIRVRLTFAFTLQFFKYKFKVLQLIRPKNLTKTYENIQPNKNGWIKGKDRQGTCNVTMRRVRVTIVAVKER